MEQNLHAYARADQEPEHILKCKPHLLKEDFYCTVLIKRREYTRRIPRKPRV
jgi:hypothetical protein